MSKKKTVFVYSQLSLKKTTNNVELEFQIEGPIRRGDLKRAYEGGCRIFGIIDGEFDQNLAVAPSEIADYLRLGCRIYGSSSMGAMRAVELESLGMIGVGRIFDYMRDRATQTRSIFRDDWLGQIFVEMPNELDQIERVAVTIPIIELLMAFAEGSNERARLERTLQRATFTFDRMNKNQVEIVLQKCGFERGKVGQITKRLFGSKTGSQKYADAIELIKRIGVDQRKILEFNSEVL